MLLLKPVNESDALTLYRLFEPEKGHAFIDLPLGSLSSFSKWINELMALEFLGLAVGRIICTESGDTAGLIILSNVDREESMAEMGTWIGASYRGKGYNEAAKNQLLHAAFEQLHLSKILMITSENNIASLRSLAKIPYVTFADQTNYEPLRKQRQFLFRHSFVVFEVTRDRFLSEMKTKKKG